MGGSNPLLDLKASTLQKIELLEGKDAPSKMKEKNKENQTPLMMAAHLGDLVTLRALLALGAQLDPADKKGRTAFNFAKNDEVRALLIQSPAFLSSASSSSSVIDSISSLSLISACEQGDEQAVQNFLRTDGLDISLWREGYTPLMAAASKDHPQIIVLLLNYLTGLINSGKFIHEGKKIDPKNFEDPKKYSALELADAFNSMYEPYLEAQDRNGATALLLAAKAGNEEAVRVLLQGHKEGPLSRMPMADIYSEDKAGLDSLMIAASQGHAQIVRILLEVGCIYSAIFSKYKNVEGSNALHLACQHGHADVVELLLEFNAEIDSRNVLGLTPLMVAAWYGHAEVAKILLENGADINLVSDQSSENVREFLEKQGMPFDDIDVFMKKHEMLFYKTVQKNQYEPKQYCALHLAAQNGHVRVLEFLLSFYSNMVNVSDRFHLRPLHLACEKGYLEVVYLLLKTGANPEAQGGELSKVGKKPLDFAMEKNHKEIQALLLEYIPIYVKRRIKARNAEEQANLFFDKFEMRSDLAQLITAAKKNDPEEVKCVFYTQLVKFKKNHLLLDKVLERMKLFGINIETKNKKRLNFLNLAILDGDTDLVSILLDRGAAINAHDPEDWSSLMGACYLGYSKVVRILLEKGADTNFKNKDGKTAYQLAEDEGHFKEGGKLVEFHDRLLPVLVSSESSSSSSSSSLIPLSEKIPDKWRLDEWNRTEAADFTPQAAPPGWVGIFPVPAAAPAAAPAPPGPIN